ncbi:MULTISPECIES: FAD-dependent oxidoreductase [unclassified Aeromicrobium]|uniref:oxidoreductase n=1 Tax=unclassified Aeromicrobium TaxID=2633570 RepID=UPI00396B46A5
MTTPVARPDLGALWSPTRIGAVEIPNRIAISAHNLAHEPRQMAAYLAARAAGGAGLVVMGGVPVHPSSMSNPLLVQAWRPESVEILSEIADTVRAAAEASPVAARLGRRGAVFSQIFHGGPNDPGNSVFHHQHVAIAPSAVAQPPSGRIPKAADRDDIAEIIDGFATTARHLQLAGFDGVEISASHGYLVHAFLSPWMNRREDEYGGNEENRARFAIEVGAAIKERCGTAFPVMLRLSLDERIGNRGLTPDSSRGLLRALRGSGQFDAFSISGGVYATLDETVAPSSAQRDAVFADSARVAREVLGPDLPIMLTGSVMALERAAELITEGVADVVGMTRSQIADPELVVKGLTGRADEVRHCIRGNQGCWRGIKTRQGVTCTVNPTAGRELAWGPEVPTTRPRRIVIVGGGPAGAKAAEVAASRGHHVTLFERGERLGGQLRHAGALPGRSSWLLAAEDLERSLAHLGVDVRTGVTATSEVVLAENPDVVLLATGSRWLTNGWSYVHAHHPAPAVAPDARVVGPDEATQHPDELGERVVVIDDTGGYAPLGVAELLLEHGVSVHLVTPRASVGDQAVLTGEASFVMPRLLGHGVPITTRTAVEAIDRTGVFLRSSITAALEHVEADTVVTCLHREPVLDLLETLRGLRPSLEIHRLGDSLSPREADDAFLEGVQVARGL